MLRLEGILAFDNPWQIIGAIVLLCLARLMAARAGWRDRRHRATTLEFIDSLLIAVLLVFCVLRPFVIQAFYIPSGSMRPTLEVNDRILVNKFIYFFRDPKAGDIVVFDAPPQALGADHQKKDFIKRVVAVPGDKIKVYDGKLHRNGQPLDERYIAEPPNYEWPMDNVYVPRPGGTPFTINREDGIGPPTGYLIVMGDNRNDSNDSHKWEARADDGMYYGAPFLPRENVLGKAMCIFWPPQRVRVLH
jgi:signal peptidase I